MKEKIQKYREYLDYIEEHYDNVQKAWALINEKCRGKGLNFIYDDSLWHQINESVKRHDESKLSELEFQSYRQFFFPCKNEKPNENIFEEGWNAHKIHNDHHWQVWTSASYNKDQLVPFVHNIVDWVAMGFKFRSTAKEYYEKNKEKINLPDWAVKLMYEIFDCIY